MVRDPRQALAVHRLVPVTDADRARLGAVGERVVAGRKFEIRDQGLIGQLVNDIVRFKRAATASRTPRDVALALSPRVPIRRVRECAA